MAGYWHTIDYAPRKEPLILAIIVNGSVEEVDYGSLEDIDITEDGTVLYGWRTLRGCISKPTHFIPAPKI